MTEEASSRRIQTTGYFEAVVRRRHPESNRMDWIGRVLRDFIEQRPDERHPDRTRYYGFIAEAAKYMRVVVMPDGLVHNAFFDRNYTREKQRGLHEAE